MEPGVHVPEGFIGNQLGIFSRYQEGEARIFRKLYLIVSCKIGPKIRLVRITGQDTVLPDGHSRKRQGTSLVILVHRVNAF